ncbi:ATP-dependent DNA helicase RecG [Marinicrinis sediminis]|uniref:ATP-dependent DNA helicase RecG n=1 Tax=Marinicrinis sediminis TaxID=1652465 RepID=A0ABW5R541_9BACL
MSVQEPSAFSLYRADMLNIYDIPVQQVQGVGPQKAEELQSLGIHSVGDLFDYYPYRYEDYRIRDLAQVKNGERITVQGRVCSEALIQRFGKKARISCKVMVEELVIKAVWFNQLYIKDRLKPGTDVVLTGKWDQHRLQITVSVYEFSSGAHSPRTGTLQPVYTLSGSISQKWLRKIMGQALKQYSSHIAEILPDQIIRKRSLMARAQGIQLIHVPEDHKEGQAARTRIAYEELFLFQLKLQAFRQLNRARADGVAHKIEAETIRQFAETLPFTLTESQKKVVNEIVKDLRAPYSMNRLVQGDVGSGKTVVAAIALYAVVKSGHQGAFMAPTEILAEQHARTLKRWFEPLGIEVALLSGGMAERKRRDLLASLQSGLTDIVVGTHALIQEDVYFRSLSLVVTDEQHRFGVNQRAVLRRKGMMPDVLSMTATPIPRTLAITAFGDLDVSTIRERPKGRKPIQTFWVKDDMLDRVLEFIEKELAQGRQAYVITPLIEESDKLDVQNAVELYELLSAHFDQYKVGLLHGRLPSDEKDATMRKFSEREIELLVSTTVIEVGVDVPNATLMIVYNADRFGLSQLHQLRGRVGRGAHQSYCILIASPRTEQGVERMTVMTETEDGFEIARRDLELRGPGDFFGTKQSGLPEFKVADLTHDFELLEWARDDTAELVAKSEFWTGVAYASLRDFLYREQIFNGEIID